MADKALDSVGEGSGSLKIIVILIAVITITFIFFSVLYILASPTYYTTKYSPEGSMVASEDENGVWKILVVKINPQVSVQSVHWYLLPPSGNWSADSADGLVSDIYGYKQGQGKAIRFVDEDFNSKLSPGDKFLIHPSEPNSDLEEIDDFSGFSFLLKFEPTGDVIGYDLQFE